MMRLFFTMIAMLAVAGTSAAQSAATPDPLSALTAQVVAGSAPSDFFLVGNLDAADLLAGTTMPQVQLTGWVFECRSGLQPVTQRIGTVGVAFFSDSGGAPFLPAHYTPTTVDRPDVASQFAPYCPAVGSHVGVDLRVDAPPSGKYTVYLSWVTLDGAGRAAQTTVSTRVIVP